jgi:hypothetical protein
LLAHKLLHISITSDVHCTGYFSDSRDEYKVSTGNNKYPTRNYLRNFTSFALEYTFFGTTFCLRASVSFFTNLFLLTTRGEDFSKKKAVWGAD